MAWFRRVEPLRFTGTVGKDEFQRRCAAVPYWYHSFHFDNGFSLRGNYDVGKDIADYVFPDVKGKRVLDVGTANGWFAFWLEQQGAEVTDVDVRDDGDLDCFGQFAHAPPSAAPNRWAEDGTPLFCRRAIDGFWVMHEMLGSKVRFRNARAGELDPDQLGIFDVVFLGTLLVHVRDPIGALCGARRVCRGQVMATTVVSDDPSPEPSQKLLANKPGDWGWWLPNAACFRAWFLAAGFREPDLKRSVTVRRDAPRQFDREDVAQRDHVLRLGVAVV